MKRLLERLQGKQVTPSVEPVRIGSAVDSERAAPESKSHGPTDDQPMRTGSSELAVIASPTWHSPAEHAAALLTWMQRPGGRVGEVSARELMAAHAEMCGEMFWEPTPWIPVAKALRRLIKDPHRHYTSRNSRRILVYHIPKSSPTLAMVSKP